MFYKPGQPERWDTVAVAEKQGLYLESCTRFETQKFPGYECKRNKTGKSFKSTQTKNQWNPGKEEVLDDTMISWLFKFGTQKPTGEVIRDDRKAHKRTEAAVCQPAQQSNSSGSKANTAAAAPGGAFDCLQCGKSFRNAQGLKTHVRQVHELKKYEKAKEKCTICGREFPDKDALHQHMMTKHDTQHSTTSLSASSSWSTARYTTDGAQHVPRAVAPEPDNIRLSKEVDASHLVRDKPHWWNSTLDEKLDSSLKSKTQDIISLDLHDLVSLLSEAKNLDACEERDSLVRENLRSLHHKFGVEHATKDLDYWLCKVCGQLVKNKNTLT